MATSPPVDPSISKRTSGFGVRLGRRTGAPTFHAGLDFRGGRGDPVFAVEDGVVEYVGEDASRARRTGGYGNVIAIRHASDQRTVYAHLSRALATVGSRVAAGKFIGSIGNTSNGKFPYMGAHLHFEVRTPTRDGGAPFPGPYRTYNIDPEPWLDSRGVRIARNGNLTLDQAMGGRAPAVPGAGLGQLPDESGLDYGVEGLPEEPMRDPWTFDPLSPIAIAGAALGGVTVLGIGGFLLLRR